MMLQRLTDIQKKLSTRMYCPTEWYGCDSCWYQLRCVYNIHIYDVYDMPEDDTDGLFYGELEGSHG